MGALLSNDISVRTRMNWSPDGEERWMEVYTGPPNSEDEYEWLRERYLAEPSEDSDSSLLGCGFILGLVVLVWLVTRA